MTLRIDKSMLYFYMAFFYPRFSIFPFNSLSFRCNNADTFYHLDGFFQAAMPTKQLHRIMF